MRREEAGEQKSKKIFKLAESPIGKSVRKTSCSLVTWLLDEVLEAIASH